MAEQQEESGTSVYPGRIRYYWSNKGAIPRWIKMGALFIWNLVVVFIATVLLHVALTELLRLVVVLWFCATLFMAPVLLWCAVVN